VVYLGRNYIAFRARERVRTITRHFDWLIREAHTGARGVPDLLTRMRREI
jgi:hypothetical protein